MRAPVKANLFKHQQEAFQNGMKTDRFAFLMEQGTGKTLSALAVIGQRYLRGEVKKLLIVCPKWVIPVWAKEFQSFANFPVDVFPFNRKKKLRILEAVKGHRKPPLMVLLMNYESVVKSINDLQKIKFDMIVLDESQEIKNHKALKSKALHRLGDRTKYKLILTGTPVSQNPLDIWSQYRFLNPTILGKNFSFFKKKHTRMGGYMNYKIVGYKNLDRLSEKIDSVAFRVTKEEALDLPDFTDQYMYIPLGKKARKVYDQMAKDSVVRLKDKIVEAPLVLTQMGKLHQIAGGFIRHEDEFGNKEVIEVGNEKLSALKDLLQSFADRKKVVIFANYIPEIKAIEKLVESIGRKSVTIRGGKRKESDPVKAFQEDPSITVCIAQIKSGGVGITLTAADTAIFYSTSFSFIAYEQARARIHRIGQQNKVTYIHLLTEDSVDLQVQSALIQKKDLADLVIDRFRKGEFLEMANVSVEEFQAKLEELRSEVEDTAEEIKALEEEESKGKLEVAAVKESDLPKPKKKKTKKAKVATEERQLELVPAPVPPKPEIKVQAPEDKSSKSTTNEGTITLKDLAVELGLDPARLRKRLRKMDNITKPANRWEWSSDDPDLETIRKAIKP